jgi:hypothetical protein
MEMIKSIRNVSIPESRLLDTIALIGFGEIYGVNIPVTVYLNSRELTDPEWKLITFIRAGHPYTDVLHIHQGAPAMAEDEEILGFKCRKKTKFA